MVAAVSQLPRTIRQAANAWKPRRLRPTPEWCEEELRIPPPLSVAETPFDLSERQFLREPLAMIDDPEVETITIMGGSQVGKTIDLFGMLCSRAHLDPAPAMLVTPDMDSSREFRDKTYAICDASKALRHDVAPPHKRNDRWIDFGSMVCYLSYSGSRQRLRGRACKYVLCTEVDVWRDYGATVNKKSGEQKQSALGKSARLVRERVKSFHEYKIVYESTPTDDASAIAELYEESDQRRWHCPCPKCGHHQELRFYPHREGEFAGCGGVAGMQRADGNWLSPDEALQAAYYVCEKGCRIDSHEKADMVAAGQWVPKGQSIDAEGNLAGSPLRSRRNVGYHVSSLLSGVITFGRIAAEYLTARTANALREFVNNWLGLKYSSKARVPDWKTLGRKLASNHRRGTVPAAAWFLTAAADVQADRVYWTVRAWGHGKTSWLVDWGMLKRIEDSPQPSDLIIASDLAQLDAACLNVEFPVVGGPNPLGMPSVPVRVLGIDAGYRIRDVHTYCRLHPGDRVRAVHGDHRVTPEMAYRCNLVEKDARTGKPYEGGLLLWGIYVNSYKSDLHARWRMTSVDVGAWNCTADVMEVGEDYLKQITNEGPVTTRNRMNRPVVNWVVRDEVLGNHYWDTEVYNSCLFDMVTGGELDSAKWERPVPPQPRHIEQREPLNVTARDYPDDFSAR